MAYDQLREASTSERTATKIYLAVLALAAQTGEAAVDRALDCLLGRSEALSVERVSEVLTGEESSQLTRHPHHETLIIPVDLSVYDGLLGSRVPAEQEVARL